MDLAMAIVDIYRVRKIKEVTRGVTGGRPAVTGGPGGPGGPGKGTTSWLMYGYYMWLRMVNGNIWN